MQDIFQETAMAEKLSALDRIKKLDEERSKIVEEAKIEALEMARQGVALLTDLGFQYDLTQVGKKAVKGARQVKRGPCPICEYETKPPHDGRQHRSQKKNKKPFTAKELAELELAKV